MSKPTVREIEEYMASLNIIDEKQFNGTAASDFDVIRKPKHYMLFDETYVKNCATFEKGIEVRDIINKLLDKMEGQYSYQFAADYVQLMQYLMRFMDKNGKEDLSKGKFYLDKLIESY